MALPACGLDLTALTRPDFSRSFVELQNLCTETRTDDFLTGWWCNFTILKNDGISQWVFHYPIYYIYEMENKIDVWNHQPVKDLKDVKECRNAAVSEARLWLAWIRKLQCSPVSLHFFAWCRTWFRFSYSASLPKFWNELEKNIEKSSQFFWEQLYHSLSSVIRSSSTSRFIHASFTLRCLRVLDMCHLINLIKAKRTAQNPSLI